MPELLNFINKNTIWFLMRTRLLTLLAFIIQIALGNICMMQMTYAAEMPHSVHMNEMDEVNMSMSDADCVHCSKKVTEDQPSGTTDCGSGYCLMHDISVDSVGLQISISTPTIAASPAQSVRTFLSMLTPADYHSTDPPGLLVQTDTIVLRN
jgi:hypothetical protein